LQGRNGVILPDGFEAAMRAWREQMQESEIRARQRKLAIALSRCLSERQRQVIGWHFKDISHEVIAAGMNLSVGEVDSIFAQALAELKRFAHELGEWVEQERANNEHMKNFIRSIN
jgi:DNA-directed RNA polymerase specialized sigma24 family protein